MSDNGNNEARKYDVAKRVLIKKINREETLDHLGLCKFFDEYITTLEGRASTYKGSDFKIKYNGYLLQICKECLEALSKYDGENPQLYLEMRLFFS